MQNFEWQFFQKEMKLKCRTKFNYAEIDYDDNDQIIEEFLEKNFIKFQIQAFKWSKEINDLYMIDINSIKASSACMFLNEMDSLKEAILN